MGREHRLQGNPRLREKSDRGAPRVPAALSVRLRTLDLAGRAAIAGIDVGEDFLDVAILTPGWRELRLRKVGLRGIGGAPLAALRGRIVAAAPELVRGAIVLIDSPRLPRDLDLASGMRTRRAQAPRSRLLDARLRALLKSHALAGGPAVALSLFPTPLVDYFARCAQSTNCKPHLAALARELLGPFIPPASRAARPALSGGAVFTRFMLAGFACYRALARVGVNPFESHPALVFNLWSSDGPVPPKRRGRDALDARRDILERLRRVVGVTQPVAVANFDQADAAVLALAAAASARRNSLVVLEHCAEGRFAVPMQPPRAVPRA